MTTTQIISEVFYVIIGLIFALVGWKAYKDTSMKARWITVAFWCILAVTFIIGPWVPYWITGALVLCIAVLTGIRGVKPSRSDDPDPATVRKNADRIGYKIFIPALALAVVALLVATLGTLPGLSFLSANNAIGISAAVALILALIMTRAPARYAVVDGTRLLDNVGSVGILPQLLTALGALFTAAGVGDVIAKGVSVIIPENARLIAVIVYCVAMAVFTIIMGNGFAAFSTITIGIGIPFLIAQGANPVVVGALGLTAGYCGTLCTPMAANFNIMPAALLELKNKYGIIKSQLPVAGVMLLIHIVLMHVFAF